jgi:hypothetical protein
LLLWRRNAQMPRQLKPNQLTNNRCHPSSKIPMLVDILYRNPQVLAASILVASSLSTPALSALLMP